tara:strand:- start:6453 stop:6665 length:213 start_codon:yes stop_codon:yes gene_type:complete
MAKCLFCNEVEVNTWFSSYCPACKKIQDLINVYGLERIVGILDNCCIRSTRQLEDKILKLNKPKTEDKGN